jgi:hypothetical protein
MESLLVAVGLIAAMHGEADDAPAWRSSAFGRRNPAC